MPQHWQAAEYWLAGNLGSGGSEAPYIARNSSYYFLFTNKGTCCKGASGTYYVVVGSSTGPYLDKNSVDLNKNSGTTLVTTQGNYVGPDYVCLFMKNGVNYFTHHYADNQNSRARFKVGNLGRDAALCLSITRN